MNTIDITTATTAELVAFWNAHAEKPVKKFADRKTAERRVAALVAELAAEQEQAAPAPNRSAAIAASWTNPETAALRAQRHAVRVNGGWFRSVPQAFRELQLPMGKHIAFRGQLREAGQLNFTHNGRDFVFELAGKEGEK